MNRRSPFTPQTSQLCSTHIDTPGRGHHEQTITVTGNLTATPTLRTLDSGDHVCNLSIASNRRVKNADTNKWEDRLDGYYDVVVWRDHGRNAAESLSKGDRIIAIGRLTTRTWTTDNGDKRYKTEIEAEEIGPSLRWAWATPIKPNNPAPDVSPNSVPF